MQSTLLITILLVALTAGLTGWIKYAMSVRQRKLEAVLRTRLHELAKPMGYEVFLAQFRQSYSAARRSSLSQVQSELDSAQWESMGR